MTRLTEFLLTYDLPLLAAANEQRGSGWIEQRTGVAVGGGVLSRDDVLALQRFEVAHAEELARIWSERDQAELLALEARVRGQRPTQSAAPEPVFRRNFSSFAFTVALLLLALAAAIALIQFTNAAEGSSHWPAVLIYVTAVALLVLGWRLGRHIWRSLHRGGSPEGGAPSG
ncbi:MAG: hypothetical protein ABI589_09235 [Burkholderiales bacterium]